MHKGFTGGNSSHRDTNLRKCSANILKKNIYNLNFFYMCVPFFKERWVSFKKKIFMHLLIENNMLQQGEGI